MKKPIAIFSSDSNPLYYEFSEIVSEMWDKCGFIPYHIKIGSDEFPLIDGVKSSLQAQISRLYASKLFPNEIILTTDIDMIPLDKEYFISKLPSSCDEIVIYSSDAYIEEKKYENFLRYPMCYLSAYGKTMREVSLAYENETWESFVIRLNSLNLGWNTDELYISEKIHNSKFKKIKYNRGWEYGMAKNRLDRADWRLKYESYIDCHSLRPYSKYKDEIDNLKNFL